MKIKPPVITIVSHGNDRFTVTINGVRAHLHWSTRRACYIAAGYIVKIGGRSNEHARYKSIPQRDRKYFVPVVASGKVAGRIWIAQPMMKFKPGRPSNKAIETVSALIDRYDLYDLALHSPESNDNNYARNWSILPDGQPIIYDYEL